MAVVTPPLLFNWMCPVTSATTVENRIPNSNAPGMPRVINPPEKGKYQYWTNAKKKTYDTAADWKEDATEHPGSWWPDWDK